MTNIESYGALAVFDTAGGTTIVPPTDISHPWSSTYNGGFAGGQQFPAEQANYLFNGMTSFEQTIQTNVANIVAELVNLLATTPTGSITPNPSLTNQVQASINGYITAHALLTGASAHGAVSIATPNEIITRDSNGRAQVVSPAVSADIATKGYVDAKVGPFYMENGNIGVYIATPIGLGLIDSNRTILNVAGQTNSSATSAGQIDLTNTRTTPASGDFCGGITFASLNNGSTPTVNSRQIASISSYLSGSGGTYGFGSFINFATKNDNTNSAFIEAGRITSNQKWLIGSTVDDGSGSLLQVAGVISTNGNSLLISGTSYINQDLRTTATPTFNGGTFNSSISIITTTTGALGLNILGRSVDSLGTLSFFNNSGSYVYGQIQSIPVTGGGLVFGNSGAEVFRYNSSNHVLIGATVDNSTGALLQVNGGVDINGALTSGSAFGVFGGFKIISSRVSPGGTAANLFNFMNANFPYSVYNTSPGSCFGLLSISSSFFLTIAWQWINSATIRFTSALSSSTYYDITAVGTLAYYNLFIGG